MPKRQVTLHDIYLARQRIAPIAKRTPLIHSIKLSKRLNKNINLKPENLQLTGSFKIRGAANKMLSLSEEEKARGVVTVSSGNHGRAVSYVAKELGIKATVCISEAVPKNKIEGMKALGAEVVISGKTYDEATDHVESLMQSRGLTMVHPFDDPVIIAGQGTIGLELIDDYPEVDTVIVPLSGGGLMGGIALAVKSIRPEIQTIGVSMARGPAMVESLKAGKVVEIVEEPTLADALAGGIGMDNQYSFPIIQKYVDHTVLVSEEEIAAGMAYVLEEQHLVVEGGGAVGVAALLFDKIAQLGEHVVVVLSGSNVDLPVLIEAVQGSYGYQEGK